MLLTLPTGHGRGDFTKPQRKILKNFWELLSQYLFDPLQARAEGGIADTDSLGDVYIGMSIQAKFSDLDRLRHQFLEPNEELL